MEILPAIDLRNGKCVRLIQGDYQREIHYSNDPAEIAEGFERANAKWIHIVDLDGARSGRVQNLPAVKAIIQAVDICVEIGGGIRNSDDIRELLDAGAARVILGTAALEDWSWFEGLVQRSELARKLSLGLDARQGRLATHGWTDQTQQSALEIARRVRGWPLAAINYTDISRDGMLAGANLEAIEKLAQATNVPVIAAGGITRLADVVALNKLPLAGIIIGRALYEGSINLSEALRIIYKSPSGD
ncbi:MAG: 1-(5-phosphoribosyl)-5-[(5-phosphoribosylamino)methylideneamino]imidazole-4-carboxamide isomerase [Actinobacteria bacterium]|nr:1-(5-phosphoribosyl)-5-[(5-phosphoribosylamino)methylideneamino]imidazole-4-carboxamide isomerase [Actinomycetota bacterium]